MSRGAAMKRPAWQRSGKEPDYRFTLANERTFLAWIRTALAILAGGVALDQFGPRTHSQLLFAAVALGLALLAGVLAASAYWRWRGNEIAMRQDAPLPAAIGIPLVGAAVAAVAAALFIGLLLDRL